MTKLSSRILTALLPDKLYQGAKAAGTAAYFGAQQLAKGNVGGAGVTALQGAGALLQGAAQDLRDIKDVFTSK